MQKKSSICVIEEGIFEFLPRKKIIVFLILKIIKNYDIFLKTRISKIPSLITQIMLLFNTLPEMSSIGPILLYKTFPPVEKVGI